MPKPNSEQIIERKGIQYIYRYGPYGEIKSINEYHPQKKYTQLLRELKPATRAKNYIDAHHKDNFLLKSAIVQAPLEYLISKGFGRRLMNGSCRY